MGQVNTVSPGVQGASSARGGKDDITLLAQSNNPTAAGNTDLGKGVVQGLGPDGKTVYAAKLIKRIYDVSSKTRFYANGKALPAHITDESAARTFARQQIANGTLGELPLGDQNAFPRAVKSAPQRAPATQASGPQWLAPVPYHEGEIACRRSDGTTLATTLKALKVGSGRTSRTVGFVADGLTAYGSTSPNRNAQPATNGLGYELGTRGKQQLITAADGKRITDLKGAQARTFALLKHGGLTMTTDAQARTVAERALRKPTAPIVAKTQITPWQPVIPLPKPIEQMTPQDRLQYTVAAAIRFAPAAAKKELRALATPQNLAALAAFAGAQFVPGVNAVANGLAAALLGKDVTETGIKFIESIYKSVTAASAFELEDSARMLAAVGAHLPATALGLMGIKPLVKGIGKGMKPPAAWAPATAPTPMPEPSQVLRRPRTRSDDAASLPPPQDTPYGRLNLSAAGLGRSLPGLNVNPLRASKNCIGAAVALDRQRAGAPASARALEMTNPADLNAFYGRLPEQGFTAKVNGRYLLPPKTRFDMASLQRYVSSLPNGARGILAVRYPQFKAGHALVVENVNGRAMFIDGQSGLVLDAKAISSGAMMLPEQAGSTQAAGRGLADLPGVNYMFLRTDDVTRLNALPNGTRQRVVAQTEGGSQRVRVTDPTGVRADEWVDVSSSPGLLPRLRPGENVYVIDDAIAGQAVRTRVIPQDAALGH